MKIHHLTPREDFNAWLESDVGYAPDPDSPESYIEPDMIAEISEAQADFLIDAGEELYGMCLDAVDKVVTDGRYAEFGVGALQAQTIEATWRRQPGWPDGSTHDLALYGRFDLLWDGKDRVKMFEFNGDTPTSAYECAVVQWEVLQDHIRRGQVERGMSQFNSLEERTKDRLGHIFATVSDTVGEELHFSCSTQHMCDLEATAYLQELAGQAGWKTKFVDEALIGAQMNRDYTGDYGTLYDEKDKPVNALYMLVPWEHAFEDRFAEFIARDEVLFIEPPWRALLSNKAILPVLWEMNPDHKYLLPATRDEPDPEWAAHVEKPIFGRLGSGVKVKFNGRVIGDRGDAGPELGEATEGYDQYPKIYQEWQSLPAVPDEGMKGWRYQTGLWVVGDGEVAGMEFRIDKELVNGSKHEKLLPHFMRPY